MRTPDESVQKPTLRRVSPRTALPFSWATSRSFSWNSVTFPRSSGSVAARMRTASSPALRALPIDTVATGTPAGICTIDSSEHPRQVGGTTGAGDDHLEPAVGGLAAVGQHLLGHPVRGDHVGLVRDA